jgi:AcrR family transcriptional regulator
VALEHFLRRRLGDAVAEKIAEDAGYSRGTVYANFDGKEGLFLAVFQQEPKHRLDEFRSILVESSSTKFKLRKIRDHIANSLTDPDWVVLRAEFCGLSLLPYELPTARMSELSAWLLEQSTTE